MVRYEYKVVPAPTKGKRAKGVRSTEERFAHALTQIMNELGDEGWEYLRADTLPCETGGGLRGKSSAYLNMLVFRRAVGGAVEVTGALPDTDDVLRAVPAEEVESPAPARVEPPLEEPDEETISEKPQDRVRSVGPALRTDPRDVAGIRKSED